MVTKKEKKTIIATFRSYGRTMSHSDAYAPWGLVVYILFTLLRFYTWINEFHVYLISDGCVRNVPTDLPQPKQKSDNGYKVVPENHRLPCTWNETLAKSCLNGGTCFASHIATNLKQLSCQ
jgi:hypothetical protein